MEWVKSLVRKKFEMEHREKIEHFPELLDYRMFNSKLELKRFVI